MDFVLGEGSRVGERLANVFFLEVRQFCDDLRRRHPVGHEIDDVCNGDSQSADRCTTSEDIWVLRDAIEGSFHNTYLWFIVAQADAPITTLSGLQLPRRSTMPTFADVTDKIYFFFDSPTTPPQDHKRDTLASVLYLLRRELIETAGYDPAAGDTEEAIDAGGVQRRLFASLILMFTGFDLLAKFQRGDRGHVRDRFKKFLKSPDGAGMTSSDAELFYAIRNSLVHAFGVPDANMLAKLGMQHVGISKERVVFKSGGLLVVQGKGDVAVIYIDGVFRTFTHAIQAYHDTLFGSASGPSRAQFEAMFEKYGTINWL